MARNVFPWLVAGGAAVAIAYYGARSAARRVDDGAESGESLDPALRNASLSYRPIGNSGERYPAWIRALRGKSGVYIIRERQRDGSSPVVYVGESHAARLYQTLTRHFQTWRRHKRFWRRHKRFWAGQYTGSQSHDPGLTYERGRCTVAVRVLSADRAMDEEARLIARLRPRDNLTGQPEDIDADEVVPF